MREEVIKDFSGKILGKVKTDEKTGDKTVRAFSGQILGYYKKQYDYTTDFYGKVVSRGDTAVSLIYQQNK